MVTVAPSTGGAVGLADGAAVGAVVGSVVGAVVGSTVGSVVGAVVGSTVGSTVGSVVGSAVGATRPSQPPWLTSPAMNVALSTPTSESELTRSMRLTSSLTEPSVFSRPSSTRARQISVSTSRRPADALLGPLMLKTPATSASSSASVAVTRSAAAIRRMCFPSPGDTQKDSGSPPDPVRRQYTYSAAVVTPPWARLSAKGRYYGILPAGSGLWSTLWDTFGVVAANYGPQAPAVTQRRTWRSEGGRQDLERRERSAAGWFARMVRDIVVPVSGSTDRPHPDHAPSRVRGWAVSPHTESG